MKRARIRKRESFRKTTDAARGKVFVTIKHLILPAVVSQLSPPTKSFLLPPVATEKDGNRREGVPR
jgi:hypothetical protein